MHFSFIFKFRPSEVQATDTQDHRYAEVLEKTQFALIPTVHKLYAMAQNQQPWELGEPELNDRGRPVFQNIAFKSENPGTSTKPSPTSCLVETKSLLGGEDPRDRWKTYPQSPSIMFVGYSPHSPTDEDYIHEDTLKPWSISSRRCQDRGAPFTRTAWATERCNVISCPSNNVDMPMLYGWSDTVSKHWRIPTEFSRSCGVDGLGCRSSRSTPAMTAMMRSIAIVTMVFLPGAFAVRDMSGPAHHIAAGTSFAVSAMVPPLRTSSGVAPAYWAVAYTSWGFAFVAFFFMELRRRPNWPQRKFLSGMVIISALYLLGSLGQIESSTLEGVLVWGPLSLTASLCVVPVLIEFFGQG